MTRTVPIRAGFIPLLDCAPLVAAARAGFAADEGLHIELVRETSWASLRDRVSVRHLDVAHMLAPMPIAASLGLMPLPARLIAPIALGFGGNTITVSNAVWAELADFGAPANFAPMPTARAFAALVRERRRRGTPRPVLAIVHPHSAHHYQLAYWLAGAGVDPKADVELVVVPPPLMPDALAGGQIDGYCVGEPWGSVAALSGSGRILTTNVHIWRSSPEKVLGLRLAWAEEQPERLARLVRAVYRAAVWCDDPANRGALADLLAAADILNRPAADLARSLSRQLPTPDGATVAVDGFLTFAAGAATFPWTSHAAWFYAQMVRWGQTTLSPEGLAQARASFRPDLYRRSIEGLGVALPAANEKVEGALTARTPVGSTGSLTLAPDGFFDGLVFDPADVTGYLAGFAARPAPPAEPLAD